MHRSATDFGIASWRAHEDNVLAQLKAIPAGSFYDVSERVLAGVLGRGSVTLPLLRELVEEWIAGAAAPASHAH